ncbi:HET domain-containing protein [Microdochium nivale]|nr:HET domain-containing protein [Microdochium nivale]
MRLINVDTLRIEEFFEHQAPRYAILSHTWGASEVSLQAFEATYDQPDSPTRSSSGYRKIFRACNQASDLGSRYCWVDTCCIDKTSSAELSEAINSMFRWYRQAAVCMVFLEDYIHPPKTNAATFRPKIECCRWFTRGWTLQELIASNNVRFYDINWCYIATKVDLNAQLSNITKIDAEVLSVPGAVFERPAACRFSWAARRVTTRIEDQAYSLMGILDVNMPLIYGEGASAFRRLQQEVLLKHDDPSLFVWCGAPGPIDQFQRMIALDVSYFNNCEPIRWLDPTGEFRGAQPGPSFAITTRGIRIRRPNLTIGRASNGRVLQPYALVLETLLDHAFPLDGRDVEGLSVLKAPMLLTLYKVGPATYARRQVPCSGYGLGHFYSRNLSEPESEIYILNDSVTYPKLAYVSIICNPPLHDLETTPFYVVQPREAWDPEHSRFLLPRNEDFWAYIKIYPEADTNFDFFVVTFYRKVGDTVTSVLLVPQEVWEMYARVRQDEGCLLLLTSNHPSTIKLEPDNNQPHLVTRFQVLVNLFFRQSCSTMNVGYNDRLIVEISLVE